MPNNMFNQGMRFLMPQMMQGALGQNIPGAPGNLVGIGEVLGNAVQGNLGITKSDETGSFTFDPYNEGFQLQSPGGFGLGVYGNKMMIPGPGFNPVPMGQTVEGTFRFGGQQQPISNRINIEGLPSEEVNTKSAAQNYLDRFITEDKINKYRGSY